VQLNAIELFMDILDKMPATDPYFEFAITAICNFASCNSLIPGPMFQDVIILNSKYLLKSLKGPIIVVKSACAIIYHLRKSNEITAIARNNIDIICSIGKFGTAILKEMAII
jgi:hypothetical protein